MDFGRVLESQMEAKIALKISENLYRFFNDLFKGFGNSKGQEMQSLAECAGCLDSSNWARTSHKSSSHGQHPLRGAADLAASRIPPGRFI